ncbi:MAG TPA: transposase [Blastocatellia bacterium]|nr:transposase [Blastocatellia bacterium]
MPTSPDFPYPRRYNSLRLLGFDYTSTSALYFLTIDTDSSRPAFGDITLAKSVLAALLHDQTEARIRIQAYTLMPDHLHLLAGVTEKGINLSTALGAFKSYTTQLYWKRSHQIIEEQRVALPPRSVQKSEPHDAAPLLAAVMEWRASLRPEMIEMKNWPRVRPEHFVGKHLWQAKFNDHIIRNNNDLRETIEYIVLNPVKRGYVSKAQFYPFTGFGRSDVRVRRGGHGGPPVQG